MLVGLVFGCVVVCVGGMCDMWIVGAMGCEVVVVEVVCLMF